MAIIRASKRRVAEQAVEGIYMDAKRQEQSKARKGYIREWRWLGASNRHTTEQDETAINGPKIMQNATCNDR